MGRFYDWAVSSRIDSLGDPRSTCSRKGASSEGVLNTVDNSNLASHAARNSSAREELQEERRERADRAVYRQRWVLSANELEENERREQRRTEITSLTSSFNSPNVTDSISDKGALSFCRTRAAANTAWGFEELRWRYCELKVSRESSSGINLLSVSTKTGPIGAGGIWGSDDADKSGSWSGWISFVYRDKGVPRCLISTRRTWRSGCSEFKAAARLSAPTACSSFSVKSSQSDTRAWERVYIAEINAYSAEWKHRKRLSKHRCYWARESSADAGAWTPVPAHRR